jgi:hypothetical protein
MEIINLTPHIINDVEGNVNYPENIQHFMHNYAASMKQEAL